MRYTWDPLKDEINIRKHGLSLEEGIPAIEDLFSVLRNDGRIDYGETRYISIGMGCNSVLYAVWAERDNDLIRIISVRKATPYERKDYDRNRT